MSEYDELVSEHRVRCMCAPHCSVPEECDMCSKEKCVHCMSADALDGLVKERDRDSHIIAREFRRAVKAALDEAVKWMDGCAVSGGYPTWHAKARKALGGDA